MKFKTKWYQSCNRNQKKPGAVLRQVAAGTILAAVIVVLSLPVNSSAAAKPNLSKKTLHMVVGKRNKLSIHHKKGYQISWKSSRKSVATVSGTGKVKAKKQGNAKITAIVKQVEGGRRYRLVCKVSVKKEKNKKVDEQPEKNGNASEKQEMNQKVAGQPKAEVQQETNQKIPGQLETDQKTPGQSGLIETMPEIIPEKPLPEQPLPEQPAEPITGGALQDGEAALLFGNYQDEMRGGDFFGDQLITSYEQLQNLIIKLEEEKIAYGNWKMGCDRLQWFEDRLGELKQDYFADHVLYISTMCVARGYDYTLGSVMTLAGKKECYLSLKRHYILPPDQCVTADMPYYSFFIQLPQGLAEDEGQIVCSLVK